MQALVIRHEAFGKLIWSPRRRAYYMVRNQQTGPLLEQALRRRREGKPWADDLPDELANQLEAIGWNHPLREIHPPPGRRLSAPLEVYFDYTWACNLARAKCGRDSYCYAAEFLGPTTMAAEQVRSVLEELHELGAMRLHLAGGEPTINRKALANYLDTASSLGLYTSMATNGLLIDDEVCDVILRNDLKSVSFSVDGPSEPTHAAVRGAGLFDKTLAGIRKFKQRRDEAGSNTRVCIKPTYAPDTPNEVLEGLVELGIELGVDVVKFANPERCLHHPKGYYGEQVDDYYAKLFFVQSLQERYGDRITITQISNPLNGCGRIGIPGLQGCIGAQELLTINPDGKITPCLMHPHDLGNLFRDYGSLRNFLASSTKLDKFVGALAKPDACEGCDIYSSCRSGSTTRRVVEVGQFNLNHTSGVFSHQKDPLCPTDYVKRHPGLVVLPSAGPEPEGIGLDEVAVRHSL